MYQEKLKKIINQFLLIIKKNKILIILTLVFIVAGFIIFFFSSIEKYFSWLAFYYFGGENSPKGEFLKVVLQTIGGVFVIIGAWAAIRRVRIMEQNSVSDKLRNAYEQVGSDKISIVKSGLYAINDIAKNNKSFKHQVFHMLLSHIRETMKDEKEWNLFKSEERKAYQLPIEAQTALDILFRIGKKIYHNYTIDLSNIKLYRANLNYVDMRNAKLNKTQLQGAFLSYTNFSGVDLNGANLSCAQLHGTNFLNAKLSNSYFIGTELNSAKFYFAKLRDSHFENSFLNDVHFECAFMHKAIFIGCNSINSNFNGTDLSRADFSGSRLVRQHFICSTLIETKYYGSYIKDSSFKGAKLVYTRFNGACSKLNSRREELTFDFFNLIKQRIDKKAELDISISFGKLSDEDKAQVIRDFKKEIKDKSLIMKFIKSISSPLFEDSDNVDKSILSKDIAQNIINQFNKAIKFEGIRL